MNAGTLKSVGGSGGVQIDNIIFNINGANLNERDIAEIAVRKMKSLDSATIRGGKILMATEEYILLVVRHINVPRHCASLRLSLSGTVPAYVPEGDEFSDFDTIRS